MKRDHKMKQSISLRFLITGVLLIGSLIGCANQSASDSSFDNENYQLQIDENAFARAKQILERYPEDNSSPALDATNDVNMATVDDVDQVPPNAQIPETEATQLMEFVDEATIEALGDDSGNQSPLPTVQRVCSGDGMNSKTSKFFENVADDCLLPKMQLASRLFNIRYGFARCIFQQENPHRDRLAHNQNGNGLAQIVNVTAKEINKRWYKGDSLALTLKQCLQSNSNRDEKFISNLSALNVPAGYNKSDILAEASSQPPSTRLNPLYRDDSLCMGLMTMGIKVQEAKGRQKDRSISDSELARRYNGSRIQQRYARAVVACIDRYKRKGQTLVSKN